MKLLLDTHIWIWSLTDPSRLAPPVREAPVTHAVAVESERLALTHWDPADRFIVATAVLLDATLVTADARLIGAGFLKVLPNP